MPLGVFYWVDMLIANTLRHTAIVSGAGSYVCVMVEVRGIEPLSEGNLERTSPGAVCYLHSLIRTGTNTLPKLVAS